jgi:hypothetical protein
MGQGMDFNQMSQMMQNPSIQRMMNRMMQNPQIMQQVSPPPPSLIFLDDEF